MMKEKYHTFVKIIKLTFFDGLNGHWIIAKDGKTVAKIFVPVDNHSPLTPNCRGVHLFQNERILVN